MTNRNTFVRMSARNGDDFIKTLAKKMGNISQKSPSLNAYINRKEIYDMMNNLRYTKGNFSNMGVIHLRGRKRVNNLHRAFVRNVLQLYRYTFVYLIASDLYRGSMPLSQKAVNTEIERLETGKAGDEIQPVVAIAPTWLKDRLADFNIPTDLYMRATQPWIETGRLINAFNVSLKKDAETGDTVITGAVGFTKKGIRKGSDGNTTAEERATLLEFGGNKQPPRPIIRLIMSSEMFKKNYKLLQEKLRSKLKPSDVKLETIARKLNKELESLGD